MYFLVNFTVEVLSKCLVTLKISVPIERKFNIFERNIYNSLCVK